MKKSAHTAGARTSVTHVTVDAEHAGRRIDNFLGGCLPGVPRARLYRLLRRGEVRVNGRRVAPGDRLAAGDVVRVPPVRAGAITATTPDPGLRARLRGRVLYEDARVLIIDKPSGIAVHGGSGLRGGVVESLRAEGGDDGYLELAHRLDRDTSGCLALARSPRELRRLHELLRSGAITKGYLALVVGRWPDDARVVEARLARGERGGERVVRVSAAGKTARTVFRPLEYYDGATLVEVTLSTGRTHQIRVHAASCGHPLAGDRKYGDREANQRLRRLGLKRLFLHANLLRIPAREGGGEIVAGAPLPEALREVLERLGGRRGAAAVPGD